MHHFIFIFIYTSLTKTFRQRKISVINSTADFLNLFLLGEF